MTPAFLRLFRLRRLSQYAVLASAALLFVTAHAGAQTNSEEDLDWVKIRDVPEDLQNRLCVNCGGRYIDPLAGSENGIPPEESDIQATATSTEMQGDIVNLKGGVEVTQGYRQLRGDEATLNRSTRAGTLTGNIELREPGVLLKGDEVQFQSATDEASLKNSAFILHKQHIRGTAGELSRDELGLIHLHQGKLTFCAPGDHDWEIRAEEMELDVEEGVGVARGASLAIGGVPVLYTPWLRFPLDDRRRTGFLWPDIGSDTRGGLDVSTPVYFNLGDNYDALYTPRYIQERGLNHDIDLRYLGPRIGYWSVGGAFMDNDDRYEDELPEERNHDRWLATIQHNALFEQRWRTQVDYSKASDADYLKDLDSSSLNAKRQSNLLQLGSVDYLGDKWLIDLDVQQFQSLADDINDDYKKLPQLTAAYRGDRQPFDFDPIVVAQYSDFDSDDDRVTGQRAYAELGTTYPMLWQQGFLTPTAKYRYLEYDLSESLLFEDQTPSTGAALASLDGGLFFERQTQIAGRGLLQTLEPRVYYLYSKFEDQSDQPDFDSAELTFSYNQLFRETRFSGKDRIDDANQLSLGLTTRFISDDTGMEKFNASIGQIFYFDDRQVRLSALSPPLEQSGSEMAGELNFYPNERLSLRSNLQYDPYSGSMVSGNFQINYIRGEGSVYNVGYTFRRSPIFGDLLPPTEQANISAHIPINHRWSVFAAFNYSVEEQESVEDMFGIEYDSCCWKFRLLHLRYFDTVPGQEPSFGIANLEREHSTQFQIVLKGMGGFGNRVEGLMGDMIRGFEDRAY